MRPITPLVLYCALMIPLAGAQIPSEELTVETMPDPDSNWFVAKTGDGAYIFDAESGEMQGMLSLSTMTPAVRPYPPRREFYAAEHYYSRGDRGTRSDMVTIYDFENLSPVAEVEIPPRMARISIRRHLGLMGDGRHLAVFNLEPAQSVSIVDVVDRNFAGEISAPGCAVIMPVADRDFLMLCGDGTLQLIQLNSDGTESDRTRSEEFFSVEEDPIFDRPVPTADGWLLVSHRGEVFPVSSSGGNIEIGESWSLVGESEDDENWRPGGGEFYTVHKDLGLLYIAMHQGGDSTHHEPGTEIWVVDIDTQRRLQRMTMDTAVETLMVTQEDDPMLIVGDEDGGTHVYDALRFTRERSLELPSASMYEDL